MEPASGSAGLATVGVLALLAAAFGQVAAEVTMVVLAAFTGCLVALSSSPKKSGFHTFTFILTGVLVALVSSWSITAVMVSQFPSLGTPYTPSLIAMLIGFSGDKLPKYFNKAIGKFGAE